MKQEVARLKAAETLPMDPGPGALKAWLESGDDEADGTGGVGAPRQAWTERQQKNRRRILLRNPRTVPQARIHRLVVVDDQEM